MSDTLRRESRNVYWRRTRQESTVRRMFPQPWRRFGRWLSGTRLQTLVGLNKPGLSDLKERSVRNSPGPGAIGYAVHRSVVTRYGVHYFVIENEEQRRWSAFRMSTPAVVIFSASVLIRRRSDARWRRQGLSPRTRIYRSSWRLSPPSQVFTLMIVILKIHRV